MKTKKITIVILTFLLAAALIVTAFCIATSGFTRSLFPGNGIPEDNGSFVVENVDSVSTPFVLESAVSEDGNSVTITATVQDSENASYDYLQSVTWSLAWASSASDDINKYVGMETNGATVTLTLKLRFSTQIILTCTSTLDTSITATATIDYYSRFTDLIVDFGKTTMVRDGNTVNAQFPKYSTYATNATWHGESLFFYKSSAFQSPGTIENRVSSRGYTVNATAAFKTALQNINSSVNANGTITDGGSGTTALGKSINDFINGICGDSALQGYGYSIFRALATTDNQFTVTATIGCAYGGTTTVNYTLNIDVEDPSVTSVTLDKNAIVF